jgi:hypothetical protein
MCETGVATGAAEMGGCFNGRSPDEPMGGTTGAATCVTELGAAAAAVSRTGAGAMGAGAGVTAGI